jgi:hypothetical protein
VRFAVLAFELIRELFDYKSLDVHEIYNMNLNLTIGRHTKKTAMLRPVV